MPRKYLEEIGWKETPTKLKHVNYERRTGVKVSDTYSVDYTMACRLYETLRGFEDFAYKVIDFDKSPDVEIDGVSKSIPMWVDEMLELCRLIISEDYATLEDESADRLWLIWYKIHKRIWW